MFQLPPSIKLLDNGLLDTSGFSRPRTTDRFTCLLKKRYSVNFEDLVVWGVGESCITYGLNDGRRCWYSFLCKEGHECRQDHAAISPSVPFNKKTDAMKFLYSVLTTFMLFSSVVVSAEPIGFVGGSRLTLGTQTNLSASVRLGDLDNDNDLDVVVANGRHWPQQNFLLLNQARGRFNVQRKLGQELRTTYATELADLDGDGDLDIAVGNDMAPNQVFLNDGTGQFQAGETFGELSSVRSLTLADLDGDQDVDIVATSRGKPNMFFLNGGKASFGNGQPFGGPADSTINVAVADLNQDGHNDLVLANRDGQQNYALLNDGRMSFDKKVTFGTSRDETRAIAIGDMNGDGKPDLIAGNIGQSNVVYLGDGAGGFQQGVPFGRPDGQTYAVTLADLDHDQKLDVVVGNVMQSNAAFFNDGTGAAFSEVRFGNEDGASYGLDVGDLDGDGFDDIVVANSGSTNRIFLNRRRR
jgi:hypothetical protein